MHIKWETKISQKRKALYSSIYIPKASIILFDENNSAILKQKKKIDKLDNDDKIMDQEKNETVFYIVQEQVYYLVLIHYLF